MLGNRSSVHRQEILTSYILTFNVANYSEVSLISYHKDLIIVSVGWKSQAITHNDLHLCWVFQLVGCRVANFKLCRGLYTFILRLDNKAGKCSRIDFSNINGDTLAHYNHSLLQLLVLVNFNVERLRFFDCPRHLEISVNEAARRSRTQRVTVLTTMEDPVGAAVLRESLWVLTTVICKRF